jgi:hypothetical protein
MLSPVTSGAVGGNGEDTPTLPTTPTTTAPASTTTTTVNSGGTTTTTTPGGIINTSCVFTKVVPVGTTYTLIVTCLFAPNSIVNITYDGTTYLTNLVVPASGVLTEVFKVTGDPVITLNGGPKKTYAFGATNTYVASGTNPEGGTNVATTYITTNPPATGNGTLAFTGADLMATIIGGVVLLIMGVALTIYARRRAERNAVAASSLSI